MEKIYQIPKSQLIVIIVFGVIGEFITLVSSTECYEDCGFSTFLLVFIPFLSVFYWVGWSHYNKKNVKVLGEEKKESSKFCTDCGQINIPSSIYCLKCGSKL
jgi:low temperature requirement protein LtrA